ncbi:hypothetical protein RJJ65_30375 [Rhizobium hidalgonense]|uniref:Uncharacterized protein n=1 Tax=Rhizobium hidalgonense TaxID=1538159 RepID=A0AAJ2GVW3_9HYPH|nr:hypothetical protein [Rhizobium hidalgonense]MDR9776885.1 hypothetical protein [Rhizobium hidalgonense]
MEPVDQYREHGRCLRRIVTLRHPARYGPGSAIANMKTIDALFRSAVSGRWEEP